MNKHFNKFNGNQKGFTIIELIVVIAIIAVLAAIVLVNVTSFINKGKDAAAEGNFATFMTDATAYYTEKGNYDDLNKTPFALNIFQALLNEGYTNGIFACNTQDCLDPATSWCSSLELKVKTPDNKTQYYCADSTGAKYLSETTKCNDSADGSPAVCSP